MDLSIVIPCYNEAENVPGLESQLGPVVSALAQTQRVEIVFVDDGSTDGTFGLLCESQAGAAWPEVTVRVVRHRQNQGLGAALRSGLGAAQGSIVVTTDSDGTYRFTEIPNLLALLAPDVDLVTASPYHPDGGVAGVPAYRLILSKGSSAIYRVLVDRHIHTYTALFRAYRRQVVESVPFTSDGFLAGTELLVGALLAGYRVAEYPAVLHRRRYSTSKAKLASTIRAHLRFQANILLRRLTHPQRSVANAAMPVRRTSGGHS